jgi:hypothetical protein
MWCPSGATAEHCRGAMIANKEKLSEMEISAEVDGFFAKST